MKRTTKGEFFPPFLFISLTNNCNLSCQGCWNYKTTPAAELDIDTVNAIIDQGKTKGCHFYGLLGGEPLLYKDLFEIFKKNQDCYFQLFTNGTLLTDAVADELSNLGNVSPLISVEGIGEAGDRRRGGADIFKKAMRAVEACAKSKLITGVATSVCNTNYNDLVNGLFLEDLIARKVIYIWYYIYRPVGLNPCPELALSSEQIKKLRRFIVDARTRHPILIIDSYWDHKGRAVCPAAMGISHHINPTGYIEPCPPIQFACDNVGDGKELAKIFDTSSFLRRFRQIASRERGCILMDNPAALMSFLVSHEAKDTSGRNTAYSELGLSSPSPSQNMDGCEIPERSIFYKIAKKKWFFGFGAYG